MSSNLKKGNKNMKKQILTSHGVSVSIPVGDGSGTLINVSKIIENKTLYRVKTADSRYLKETFNNNCTADSNGTLFMKIHIYE
jgi:hypothetical protein